MNPSVSLCNNLHGIIHLVRTQNFPKNQNFLPPDTHAYAHVRVRIMG